MGVATVRETANFTNKTNAVTPYTLGQVLESYATQSYVAAAISAAVIDPSQIDLSAYAKKTDLPKKLSELTNDANYVQTVGGFIPSNLLPSYVDDVLEYANISSFPSPGESGKIYVALDTNLTYRWSGSEYIEISKSLALGTTSTTAFRGDYGQTAYTHSQTTGNPHNTTLANLGVTVSAAVINYLDGLDANIMTKLGEKLSLSGGTMTGYITLHHDPTQKMHAANKDYVDKEINGISVIVTQNVTHISELQSDVNNLSTTVGTQAQTLVTVQNDITGLNQTTSDHTSYISSMQQDISGISTTVTADHSSLTVLEATVNQLEPVFDAQALFVLVDEDSIPLSSTTYYANFICKYRGEEIEDYDDITIALTGNHTGITTAIDKTNKRISFTVANNVAITNVTNSYSINFQYTAGGFQWENSRTIIVTTVPKGDTGPQGPQGTSGAAGISITGVIEYYYKSTSPTTLTGGVWSLTYPGWQDGYYIWTKTKITYSNSTYEETTPICVTGSEGATGSTGPAGTSVSQVDVLYYNSTSATTLSGGSWQTTVPTWEDGKFLWTKTRITYSTGFSDETAPACVTGSTGATGATGADGTSVTISSTEVKYQQGDSGTTAPTGTWSSAVPSITQGKYLWTRTIVNYSNGTSTTSYAVAYNGENGQQGAQGNPGQSYYTHIRYSENSDGTDFSDTPSTTRVYIGVYSGTSSTAPSDKTQYTWSKYKGDKGDTGSAGVAGNGINSITYYYKTTTTQTAPSASSITGTTIPVMSSTDKYLWQKEVIDFTDTSVQDQVSVLLLAVYGDRGAQGPQGDPGTAGASIVWKGSMAIAPLNPQNLWAYYNTTDGVSYVYDGTQWQTLAEDGSPGTPGTQYYYHTVYCNDTTLGTGYSTTANGQDYMGTYADTSTIDAATFSEATSKGVKWSYIKGEAGDQNVVISDTAPSDNDVLWLDTETGFMKRWVPDSEGSLTGDWEATNDISDITGDMQSTLRDLVSTTSDLEESLSTYTQSVDETIQTKVNQKADSWGLQFDHYKEIVEGYEGQMNTYITNTKKWIDFIDGTIYLGNTESLFTLQIQNDRIEICYDGTPLSRWNTELFYSKEILARKFVLRDSSWGATGFAFVANSNGSLSFRKIDLTNDEISQTN